MESVSRFLINNLWIIHGSVTRCSPQMCRCLFIFVLRTCGRARTKSLTRELPGGRTLREEGVPR